MGNKNLQAAVAAMASFFAVTVILAIAFFVCRRSQSRRRKGRSVSAAENPRRLDESHSFDPALLQTAHISMERILSATRNFSPDLIVGDGSFGLVYRAQLSDGRTVAVKKLDPDAFQGFREFRAEIETLGFLHHPNLARILGYCSSAADRILIYEFVERGNLDVWLHDDAHAGERLPWPVRLKVARGVAAGLAYLHGLPKPIIHRDIKASNVLLDSDFEPRISDFGLARRVDSSQSHVSTQVAGTMGYMPPEYKAGFTVATLKADIYSFGVLMLEIVVARRPNLPVHWDGAVDGDTSEIGLAQWARRMINSGRHMDVLDPTLAAHSLPPDSEVLNYLRIALLCANEHHRERPAMREVVDLLDSPV